jgi:AbrB family looped-hinge helix DNA binding protein
MTEIKMYDQGKCSAMRETQHSQKRYVMKLGEKFQVVIPKPVRDAPNIKARDEVIMSVQNGNVIM